MTADIPARCLADFFGTWRIRRDICPVEGPQARFEGKAEWSKVPDGAVYVEKGQLHMPGQGTFEAERRYHWHEDLRVFFDDGRFFHAVPAQGGESAHWCDPDQYDATYQFSDWPEWSCRWRVKGPRKDYEMLSRYCRM